MGCGSFELMWDEATGCVELAKVCGIYVERNGVQSMN
jgi:hypothetical protein